MNHNYNNDHYKIKLSETNQMILCRTISNNNKYSRNKIKSNYKLRNEFPLITQNINYEYDNENIKIKKVKLKVSKKLYLRDNLIYLNNLKNNNRNKKEKMDNLFKKLDNKKQFKNVFDYINYQFRGPEKLISERFLKKILIINDETQKLNTVLNIKKFVN